MAAYLVLMQQVDDVDRYRAECIPGVRPFLERYGAKVLVAGFEAEPAEAARGMINDPDRPVRELRHSITSRAQAVIVPELSPAG